MAETRKSKEFFQNYAQRLSSSILSFDWTPVVTLAHEMDKAWAGDRQVFICGNGGSAANANHWANDFTYPVDKSGGRTIRIHSLCANQAILTCLGNDVGYDNIYSHQLKTYAHKDDLLIVLSGSGNSPNILNALETAKKIGLQSFAILGFTGGKALSLADTPIHLQINDMQIAEDFQSIVCHMLMQSLVRA